MIAINQATRWKAILIVILLPLFRHGLPSSCAMDGNVSFAYAFE